MVGHRPTAEILLRPLLTRLSDYGIGRVVVQPNVLSLVVDDTGQTFPKTEFRVVAFPQGQASGQ